MAMRGAGKERRQGVAVEAAWDLCSLGRKVTRELASFQLPQEVPQVIGNVSDITNENQQHLEQWFICTCTSIRDSPNINWFSGLQLITPGRKGCNG
jgi:hypothetical protein